MNEPAVADRVPPVHESGALDAEDAVDRAEELLDQGDSRQARAVVAEAIGSVGQTVGLMWALAEVEFFEGDFGAGDDAVNWVLAEHPDDPVWVARHIWLLRSYDRWREAVAVVEGLPEEIRSHPEVRGAAGMFYKSLGCPAHAVVAWGSSKGMIRAVKLAWWQCWLRSARPSRYLRQRTLSWEALVLEDLKQPDAHLDLLHDINGLDSRRVRQVKNRLEAFNFLHGLKYYRTMAVRRAGFRLIPLAMLPVWLVLMAVSSMAGFPPGPLTRLGYAAVSAAIAMIPVVAVVLIVLEPVGRFRKAVTLNQILSAWFAVVVAETAAGAAYARGILPIAGWPGAFVLGLVAALPSVCCLPAADLVAAAFRGRWFRTLYREDPLLPVLNPLLAVLYSLRFPQRYRGMREPIGSAALLERAAHNMTQYIVSRSSMGGLGSYDWLSRRAAGWAEAVRQMQRQVIAPVPGDWDKLDRRLVHEIRCLASGELGALAWTRPPPVPSRRIVIRRRAIATARAVIVAGLPLTALLTARQFLHMSPTLFNAACIVTGAWALLYVLLSIDPAVRDKIAVAKELADLVRPGSSSSVGG